MESASDSLRTLITQMETRVILHVDMDAFYCQVLDLTFLLLQLSIYEH